MSNISRNSGNTNSESFSSGASNSGNNLSEKINSKINSKINFSSNFSIIEQLMNLIILEVRSKYSDEKINWVVLDLSETDVNLLSNELQDTKNIINIISEWFKRNWLTLTQNTTDWSLQITGFKYGRKKNSPRKIGLTAIRGNASFKSPVFYNDKKINKKINEELKKRMNEENYLFGNFYNNKKNKILETIIAEEAERIHDDIQRYLNEPDYLSSNNFIRNERPKRSKSFKVSRNPVRKPVRNVVRNQVRNPVRKVVRKVVRKSVTPVLRKSVTPVVRKSVTPILSKKNQAIKNKKVKEAKEQKDKENKETLIRKTVQAGIFLSENNQNKPLKELKSIIKDKLKEQREKYVNKVKKELIKQREIEAKEKKAEYLEKIRNENGIVLSKTNQEKNLKVIKEIVAQIKNPSNKLNMTGKKAEQKAKYEKELSNAKEIRKYEKEIRQQQQQQIKENLNKRAQIKKEKKEEKERLNKIKQN
jgi:hypothetical protein